MVDFEYKSHYSVKDLVEIVKILRAPGGCPWDAEQTHESIRRNLLEEAYEAAEAIDEKSTAHLLEELGDVLLQIVFHARMEEEKGGFTLEDVADGVCKKLIHRHPHVFGDVKAENAQQVLENWDQIKRSEKKQESTAAAMDSVARSLPALWRAEKVQHKAAKAGFDWPDVSGALDKLDEEVRELREAVADGRGVEEELGDVLFSAVNVARFAHKDPEEALNKSCDKFISRFAGVERAALAAGRKPEEMTLAELDALYEQMKLKSGH